MTNVTIKILHDVCIAANRGKMEGKILESIMMGGWNMVKSFVSILYKHIVVGEVVNLIDDIYGGRTSLFLTSQRMPAATDAYTRIYNCKNITIL